MLLLDGFLDMAFQAQTELGLVFIHFDQTNNTTCSEHLVNSYARAGWLVSMPIPPWQ